jgi:hypothetical protein
VRNRLRDGARRAATSYCGDDDESEDAEPSHGATLSAACGVVNSCIRPTGPARASEPQRLGSLRKAVESGVVFEERIELLSPLRAA